MSNAKILTPHKETGLALKETQYAKLDIYQTSSGLINESLLLCEAISMRGTFDSPTLYIQIYLFYRINGFNPGVTGIQGMHVAIDGLLSSRMFPQNIYCRLWIYVRTALGTNTLCFRLKLNKKKYYALAHTSQVY